MTDTVTEAPVVKTPVDASVETPVEANDDWRNDPRLDENGNPKTEVAAPAAEEPTTEEPAADEAPAAPEFDQRRAKEVGEFLTAAGIDPSELAEAVQLANGEIPLDAVKKLTEKHGEAIANLILDRIKGMHEQAQAVITARREGIYNQVQEAFKDVTDQPGSQTWKELSQWAKSTIPEAERAELNDLIQAGGVAAKLAIADLVNRFRSSKSFVKPAKLVGDTVASNAGNNAPLSRAQYTAELDKLLAAGHVYGQSPEIAALDRRRLQSKNRGY